MCTTATVVAVLGILAGFAVSAQLFDVFSYSSEQSDFRAQTFYDPSNVLKLTAPQGWVEDNRIMPFDLAIWEEQQAYYTGVMIYYKRESGGEKAVLENLQFHMQDIASKREHIQVLFAPKQERIDTRILTKAAICGKYAGREYAYLFTAIDFGKAEDAFAILIGTANLSDWEDAQGILEEIGNSCVPLEEKTDAR